MNSCPKCGENASVPRSDNWRFVTCLFCGGHPENERELYRWVEGMCVKCQQKHGIGRKNAG